MHSPAHEESIEIAADPHAVFDLIHDYGKRLEWDPFLKEARILDREIACAGATTRCVAHSGLAMDTVYVSFDRPHVAAVKMVSGPTILRSFAASLRQERIGDCLTRVTYRYQFETRLAIMQPLCNWLFARETRKRLLALKAYMERRS